MREIYIWSLFFICIMSCSHKDIIRETQVSGSCSEQLKLIKPPVGQNLIDLTKQATLGSVSIAITGAGAITDALVISLTNPVSNFSLCVISVALITSGKQVRGDLCNNISEETYNPKFTHKTFNYTESWRCPNLDYVSRGLRNVASCYTAKNEKDNALEQLNNIIDHQKLSKCISKDEMLEVQNQINRLELL